MPESEHFTKEQQEELKKIYHEETNKLLVKIVSANLVTFFIAAMAIGAGWWRLDSVESDLAAVVTFINEGPRFTEEEGLAEKEARIAADANLQRQIDEQRETAREIKAGVDKLNDKFDRYIIGQ